MTSIPTNKPQDQSLVTELEALRHETRQLLLLNYELAAAIDAVLDGVAASASRGPGLRKAAVLYMASAPNRQLRQDLIAARGPQSAASLRTKLNADLEARRGRRHPSNGQAAVHANGNGNGAMSIASE